LNNILYGEWGLSYSLAVISVDSQARAIEEARAALGLETFEFDRVIVGQLLKSARDCLGVKLKHVEVGTGIAASHIWNIEQGKKDVSLERCLRLACFYGFPPGLLLEAGIRVKWDPILAAAKENVDGVMKGWGWRKVTPARREVVAEFIAGLATIMTYLLRSTRPGFLIEFFDMPSPELKHRFRLAGQKFEFFIPPYQRMVWLQYMHLLPERPLLDCRLLRAEDAQWYEEVVAADLPSTPRPWIPKPRGCLADFKKAIDIPAQSKEEHDYLNALSKAQRGAPALTKAA
jgi:transcriptional regulator with XRE-family HTH domain